MQFVYAGHDVTAKVKAHSASGETVQNVFAAEGIMLTLADTDKVNGGRAVNRQLKRGSVKIVRTTGNLRVFDQLGEIVPDPDDVRKPLKVDADPESGVGGDDGADMFRYGVATRVRAAKNPEGEPAQDAKLPHRAKPIVIEHGRVVPSKRAPQTVQELMDSIESKRGTQRTEHRERLPRRVYR